MSLGDIVGQLLQQGIRNGGRERLDHTLGAGGLGGLSGGGGLEDILGGLLGRQGSTGAQSGGAGAGGLGSLLELAAGALGGRNAGGARTGSAGGLGDLAGVLLGGGTPGSGRTSQGGNGMALLGTLALAAFRHWQQSQNASAAMATPEIGPQQMAALTSPGTERLILSAMISAAKADGKVDDEEIQRIVGKIDSDGVSPEERQFIVEELRKAPDLRSLVAEVPNQLIGAEVYAASLLAISLDSEAERTYLRTLAQMLQLDQRAVERLHSLTGAGLPR